MFGKNLHNQDNDSFYDEEGHSKKYSQRRKDIRNNSNKTYWKELKKDNSKKFYSHRTLDDIERSESKESSPHSKLSHHKSEGKLRKKVKKSRTSTFDSDEENGNYQKLYRKKLKEGWRDRSDSESDRSKESKTHRSSYVESSASSLKRSDKKLFSYRETDTEKSNSFCRNSLDFENSAIKKSKSSLLEKRDSYHKDRSSKRTNKIFEINQYANKKVTFNGVKTIDSKSITSSEPTSKIKELKEMIGQLQPINKNNKQLETVSQVIRRGEVVILKKRLEELSSTSSCEEDSGTDISSFKNNRRRKSRPSPIFSDEKISNSTSKDTRNTRRKSILNESTSESLFFHESSTSLNPRSYKHRESSSDKQKRARLPSLSSDPKHNQRRSNDRDRKSSSSTLFEKRSPDKHNTRRRTDSYDKPSVADKDCKTRLQRHMKGYSNENLFSDLIEDDSVFEIDTKENPRRSSNSQNSFISIRSHKPFKIPLENGDNTKPSKRKRSRDYNIDKSKNVETGSIMTCIKSKQKMSECETTSDSLKSTSRNFFKSPTKDFTKSDISDERKEIKYKEKSIFSKSKVDILDKDVTDSLNPLCNKKSKSDTKFNSNDLSIKHERLFKNTSLLSSIPKVSPLKSSVEEESCKISSVLDYLSVDKEVPPPPINSDEDDSNDKVASHKNISIVSKELNDISFENDQINDVESFKETQRKKYKNNLPEVDINAKSEVKTTTLKNKSLKRTSSRSKTYEAFENKQYEKNETYKSKTLPVFSSKSEKTNTPLDLKLQAADSIVRSYNDNKSILHSFEQSNLSSTPTSTKSKSNSFSSNQSLSSKCLISQNSQKSNKLRRRYTVAECLHLCRNKLRSKGRSYSFNCLNSSVSMKKIKSFISEKKSPKNSFDSKQHSEYITPSISTRNSSNLTKESSKTQQNLPTGVENHQNDKVQKQCAIYDESCKENVKIDIEDEGYPKDTIVNTHAVVPNRDELVIDGESISEQNIDENPHPKTCWEYDKTQSWYVNSGKGLGWKILLAPVILILGPFIWAFKILNLNSQLSSCWKDCWYVDQKEYWFSCKGKGRGWICLLIPLYLFLGPLIFVFTLFTVILLSCCGGDSGKKKPQGATRQNLQIGPRNLERREITTHRIQPGCRPITYGMTN